MAYQSLYRRYRSQKFSELRGQSHVTSALQTAVAEGRHGHAYLFSGPRGTGKTSTARILAKALNCPNVADGEPCGECESCVAIEQGKSFDLHELDAASHNKVDDIRDLISKVHLGSPGQTKVYILDEVHMLSAGAENALLKTLEEPPEHVVFVLATTEPHKVVPTIRSRTQHFEFHLLPAEDLAEHVKFIIEDAGLDVDDSAVDYVLTQGGGSARDTLSALDLVAAGGVPAGSDVGVALAKAIGAGDGAAVIGGVQEALTSGQEPRIIGEITVDLLRNAFLASMGAPLNHLNDRSEAISRELASELGAATLTRSLEALGQALVEMRQAPDPRVPLEVTLLRLCRPPGPLPLGEPASDSAPTPVAAPAAAPAGGQAGDPALTGRVEELERQLAALQAQLNDLAANPGALAGGAAAAAPTGPAAAARSKLSEVTSKQPPSPRSKRRSDQGSAPAAQPAQDSEPTPQQTEQQPTEQPAAEEPATERPAAEQPPAAQPAAEQPAATSAPSAEPAPVGKPNLSAALTLAAVVDAFDQQLDGVKQKVRVRFKGGRVLSVEGNTVVFGVPQAIHRDRCIEVKQDIEQAFSNHFGQPVTLDVVVDDNAPTPTMDPARIESKPPREITPDEEVGPVEELADANDQSADGVERLTKAFPGSKVVEPQPE